MKTHGESRTSAEYRAWSGMIKRCHSKIHIQYKDYGGRGIFVCERWRNSYETFLADMGRRPSNRHSIDRIDNDRGYSPDNCRWATSKEQLRNTRVNRILTIDGVSLCVSAWAELKSVRVGTINARLSYGWTAEDAVNTPVRGYGC